MAESTQGQLTVEQFQRQQQIGMLATTHALLVNCITMNPAPSKMPTEVRVQMYKTLRRITTLFDPRNDEERALAEEEIGNVP